MEAQGLPPKVQLRHRHDVSLEKDNSTHCKGLRVVLCTPGTAPNLLSWDPSCRPLFVLVDVNAGSGNRVRRIAPRTKYPEPPIGGGNCSTGLSPLQHSRISSGTFKLMREASFNPVHNHTSRACPRPFLQQEKHTRNQSCWQRFRYG